MTDSRMPPFPPEQGDDELFSRDSERLLRALRVAVPVEDPARVAARRNALISVIQTEIAHTPHRIRRQERFRQMLGGTVAAAALAFVVFAGTQAWDRFGPLTQSSHLATLPRVDGVPDGRAEVILRGENDDQRQTMVSGQELSLHGEQWLSAELPGATKIELRSEETNQNAHLKLSQLLNQDQSLFMSSGRLSVDVPEGSKVRRHVMVVTPDAKVEVKGTKFTVDVANSGTHSQTEVSVLRGQVQVTWLGGKRLLNPGQTWKSDPHEMAVSRTATTNDDRASRGDAPSRDDAPSGRRTTSAPPERPAQAASARMDQRRSVSSKSTARLSGSTLAEQNRLLERAVGEQKSGNNNKALELIEELLRKYPDSPLRSTAIAERRRIRDERP